ncbi:hypothetical protein [Magnetospira sp. QH-2]|uniref:hypothetical protein n=1 Tax=Magnetospira sp. (strain QH-2) TaxID=1288970 RepID=UPI0003E81968|nr:hypothetical protein [Magnetospira sp. QH-2]CCQ73022.1 protein of unknown function [Magnetospira sp. QH-2]
MPPLPLKLILAGRDDHDPALQALASALRDGGMEVVYLGKAPAATVLADVALQEDARGIVLVGVERVDIPDVPVASIDPDSEDGGAEALRQLLENLS